MKAFIDPAGDAGASRIEIQDGDRFQFVLAQICIPFLQNRLAGVESGTMPYIDQTDLPAWMRRADDDDDHLRAMDGRDRERWRYILEEMIWALEATTLGIRGMMRHVVENGEYDLLPNPAGPGGYDIKVRKAGVVDTEGARTDAERRREGMRLFGRYAAAI